MSGARHYAVVTAAYWGFTLTDGALRMLVLLHFYRLGYSPFSLALLFLLLALFFLALLMGAATFNLFYSFLAGLLVFSGLYGFARWATAKDPQMLQIMLASSSARRRYDPGKHEPFEVEVSSW